MGQSDGFDHVFVQAEGPGHRSPQLRNLQRMREAGAKEVAFVVDEHLCLVNQAPESGGMNNPIPIPLKRGPGRRRLLKKASPPAGLRQTGVGLKLIHKITPSPLFYMREQLLFL